MRFVNTSAVRRVFLAAVGVPVLAVAALAGSNPAAGSGGITVINSLGPMTVPGVPIDNFGVVDGRVFRGEQPRNEDYRALATLGITTIVDLRLDARKDARSLAEAAGLTYVNIPIDDKKQPTDADVARFVAVVDASPSAKVYVHCAGGRHRTGSMIAVYRMVHDGWSIDQAYDEMLKYDFYTRNGHGGFKTFVFDYYGRMTQDPTSVPVAFKAIKREADGVACPVDATACPADAVETSAP